MGIFDKMKSAIFGSAKANEAAPTASGGASPTKQGAAGSSGGAAAAAPTKTAAGTASASGAAAPMSQVDVDKVLTGLAAKNQQKLDCRKSIVDLMKLLDLDSSLDTRKALAKELGYTGDMGDSATMNVWLHKQVMAKLMESGGVVPDSLRG